MGEISDWKTFSGGSSFVIKNVVIHTVSTPHDGVDGVCFVVEYGGRRLGILTDLGYVFGELEGLMPTLDGVYLESNHDRQMLECGPYPNWLKRRVKGSGGHLSNDDAARLLNDHTGSRLQWAVLAHLSHHNNTPELALKTCETTLNGRNHRLPIHVAHRSCCSPVYQIF